MGIEVKDKIGERREKEKIKRIENHLD